jgi:hypothetical protein
MNKEVFRGTNMIKLNEALGFAGSLMKRDGWTQIDTVQGWLDVAYQRPSQFEASQGALEILRILGHGGQLVPIPV